MVLSSSNDPDAEKLSPHDSQSVLTSALDLANLTDYYPGNVGLPLKNSVPLEAPRPTYRVPLHSSVAVPSNEQPNTERLSEADNPFSLDRNHSITQPKVLPLRQSSISARVDDVTIIPLLEERLVVDRRKRKVSEVVVRKEIETYIVEVPVRREKLIVEQVSPEYKQLAVVDLGQVQANDINVSALNGSTLDGSHLNESHNHLPPTVSAKFTSVNAALEFLEAIASHSDPTAVQISLALADENMQAAYQKWLKQHSN